MSKKIWCIAQQREGKLHRSAREVVAAGQKLAEIVGGSVSAVVLGSGVGEMAEELQGLDLEAVLTADHEHLGQYTPGAYVGALASAMASASPDYVLFAHTYQSVDYAPRLAHETGAALVSEAVALEAGEGGVVFHRPILGGKLQAKVKTRGEGPVVVSVQSGAFPADDAKAGSCAAGALEFDASAVVPDREILGVEQVGGDQVDLSKAAIIVAAGRGVGGEDKMGPIEELAKVLGAEIGASRPVIDNGWLPRDRQIGSSGQTVAPKLYLAIGISGAIQHLVGMKGSSCVVAINKDASAPIFNVANYGIVGDLHEVVPALTAALAERQG